MDVAALLRAFADLAPAGQRPRYDVSRDGPFLYLGGETQSTLGRLIPDNEAEGLANVSPYAATHIYSTERQRKLHEPALTATIPGHPTMHRLAALDALHSDERLLREGFGWLCGPLMIDGREERVLLPLVAAPVRVASSPQRALGRAGRFTLAPAGDREILPLVDDPDVAADLERRTTLGAGSLTDGMSEALLQRFHHLQSWVRDLLTAAGVHGVRVLPPGNDPTVLQVRDQPAVVVGHALFVARDVHGLDLRNVLRSWAGVPGIDETALARLYEDGSAVEGPLSHAADGGVHGAPPLESGGSATTTPTSSPLPLSAVQREVVVRARHEPIVVVSGPPGSGKSHTVAAVAVDAVAQGKSVLIATQSIHAADVLGELLERQPGPDPVLFGDAERHTDLANVLAGGVEAGRRLAGLPLEQQVVAEARARVDTLESVIAEALGAELAATGAERWEVLLPALQEAAPGVFDIDADLDELSTLSGHALTDDASSGWRARLRRRRAEAQLRKRARADPATPISEIARAVRTARSRRAASKLAAEGGTTLTALWDELERAESDVRLVLGRTLATWARAAPNASTRNRQAIGALATALRAGRGTRRQLLRRIDGASLTRALPLWIGTLRDVEDLLPATPGVFDVVIVDEASQVDQIRLALALLRGRRAVIAGDPRQLRHVSFVADVDIAETLAAHGLAPWADRLDVRRVSGFDAAAARSPVTFLDEHYRSVPHLIEFSARHFYPEPIQLVTRHPSSESTDAITVVGVDGSRDGEGINAAEVAEVERQVRAFAAGGWRSIGVITPFRPQADALEAMLLERFELDEITELGLRVGTVHAFQGSERDAVVISLGLGPDEPAGSTRFVQDPHLFNVMITRARYHLVVVTSLDREEMSRTNGILADFLAHAAAPPSPFPVVVPQARSRTSPRIEARAPASHAADESGRSLTQLTRSSAPPTQAPPPPNAPRRDSGPRDRPPETGGWSKDLATELARLDLPVRTDYPVGRWTIDIVAGGGDLAVAIETSVHPDGIDAHIERHRTLRNSGWTVIDAYPTHFEHSVVAAALHLAQVLAVPRSPT